MSHPRPHIDTKACYDELLKMGPESILSLAAAAANDPTLLAQFERWVDETSSAASQLPRLKQRSVTTLRRGDKKDDFATGALLQGVISDQQYKILMQIITKCKAIQEHRLSLLLQQQKQQQEGGIAGAPVSTTNPAITPTLLQSAFFPSTSALPPPPLAPNFRLYLGGLDPHTETPLLRELLINSLPGFKALSHPFSRNNPSLHSTYAFVELNSYNEFESTLTRRTPLVFNGRELKFEIPKDGLEGITPWLNAQRAYEDKHGLLHSFKLPTDGPDVLLQQQQLQQQQQGGMKIEEGMNNINVNNNNNNNNGNVNINSNNVNKDANNTNTNMNNPNTSAIPLENDPSNALPIANPSHGTTVCIADMFTQDDKDEATEDELREEIEIQCVKFGQIVNITIRLSKSITSHNQQQYFPVFVQYNTNAEATQALRALQALTFAGRRLYVYVTTQ